jgi:hypothetical protein
MTAVRRKTEREMEKDTLVFTVDPPLAVSWA